MDQPFKQIDHTEIYSGRVLDLHVDTVSYQDRTFKWEIVAMGHAVVVVPVLREDEFIILHQYRYTARDYIWEFPAGRAEEGESFETSAQRELEEECGYRANRLIPSLRYYPSPGVLTEQMHLFYAFDLYEKNEASADDDEIIQQRIIHASELETMIDSGAIYDAKTILAYYHYKLHKRSLSDAGS